MTDDTRRATPKPPVDRFSEAWKRINEHKLVQWTVAYIAIAYALQHGVILTSESFEWPNAVARTTMLLLVLGLPIAITFAWYHGAQASRQISKAEMSIISILLVIGTFLFYALAQPSREVAGAAPTRDAGVTAARSAAANPRLGIALAVLPFANLSDDKEQEFFSDGVTEEITSALAKIPDLSVVARTSAFQFKGQNRDVQGIGQQLRATHLIEGSVRKAGDRLRITAELVKADDGVTIWTDSYDRQLTDVFAIQEDIAHAVATSLHMTLGLKPGENLVSNRKIDPESYQQYLRAKARYQAGNRQAFREAATLLEQVVARSPDYAPAWAQLGFTYAAVGANTALTGRPDESRSTFAEFASKSEMAARRAIQLDPNLPDGYTRLAVLEHARGHFAAGEDLMKKALALDADNPDALDVYSLLVATVGRLKEAEPIRLKLQSVEPFVPLYNSTTATLLWANGKNDTALAMFTALPGNIRSARARGIAISYAAAGRYDEAADALAQISPAVTPVDIVQAAARILRSAPKAMPPGNRPDLGNLNWIYVYVGAPEQSLRWHEKLVDIGIFYGSRAIEFWHPDFAPARKTEGFKGFVRKAGLVDYWKARGWPPQCHPTTGDDFACE